MKVLVTGGAGYIGSHMVKLLLENQCEVTVLDNLSTGYAEAIVGGRFILGDIGDNALLTRLFTENHFDAVMHFAASIQVDQSITHPSEYYENNVTKTLALLNAMVRHQVLSVIFSSSAAVYGEPQYTPVDENHPKLPINPYGASKWMIEQVLQHYCTAYLLKSISLRYFNAAGAEPNGVLGSQHWPETHLIPLVLQAASGRRHSITISGDDYDTPDGTCVRDYIHVNDICQAHLLAVKQLLSVSCPIVKAYNLGNGNGYSVKEVIAAAEKITEKKIAVQKSGRRKGDPAKLTANSSCVKQDLRWTPQFANLETIMLHAWNWENKLRRSSSHQIAA